MQHALVAPIAGVAAFVLVMLLSCAPASDTPAVACEGCNVVLIVLDAARAAEFDKADVG